MRQLLERHMPLTPPNPHAPAAQGILTPIWHFPSLLPC